MDSERQSPTFFYESLTLRARLANGLFTRGRRKLDANDGRVGSGKPPDRLAPVWFNDEGINGEWKVTAQLDVNLPSLAD